MADQRKQPGFVMAILALLGVFSLPQIVKSPDHGRRNLLRSHPLPAPGAADGGDGPEPEDPDIRTLKPLIEYLAQGETPSLKKEDLACFLCENLPNTNSNVYSLIITLPDPVQSVASGRFDEELDVVQRAIELQGYILDRSRLPWKKPPQDSSGPADTTTTVRQGKQPLFELETTTKDRKDSRLGLMVFKHLLPDEPDPSKPHHPKLMNPPSILLAFIVPESPISGIDKAAFVEGLNLVHDHFRIYLTHEKKDPQQPVLHIIAPRFNGSQRSLEQAISGWTPNSQYHFRVISSGAGLINQTRLQRILPYVNGRPGITFSSMVHEATGIKDVIVDHLKARYKASEIAVLVESNSGLAQALVRHEQKKAESKLAQTWLPREEQNAAEQEEAPDGVAKGENQKLPAAKSANVEDEVPVEFIFPLQVAELRRAYEAAGVERAMARLATRERQ